jgi:hypothetical protein
MGGQTQGEVARMVRVPNGDVHVAFKSADVAEEVCRLRARVIMPHVGPVHLSWFQGKGPP